MRVKLKTKNKGIKQETYPCRKCSEPIKAGEKYYEWKHRHADPSRQHSTHGAPKQSELCTGKMSGVYAANEALEEAIASGDHGGLADALTSCAESVREVAQEYEDNRSNMPESLQDGTVGSEMEEKANSLNEYADELENAAGDASVTDWEYDEDEPEVMDDHTDECAVTKKCAEPGGEATDEECDCGYTDSEAKHDEWEQSKEEHEQEAIDRAREALDSFPL